MTTTQKKSGLRISCDSCHKDLGVATGVTLRDVNQARRSGRPVVCANCHADRRVVDVAGTRWVQVRREDGTWWKRIDYLPELLLSARIA